MKRVSSAPSLSELGASSQGPPSKALGTHPQTFKTSSVLATGQSAKRANSLVASAMAFDAPPDTTIPMSPAPSTEITYALASRGISFLECLPSIEMKDAPSLDLATCMATPVIPDDGLGAEVRQRAAAIATEAEAQLRLRYVEEITARAAVRLGRITNRKRSLDDLDLHEALQELESSSLPPSSTVPKRNADGSENENIDHKEEEQKKKYEEELRGPQKSNVVPFKRPSTAAVLAVAKTKPSPSP